QDRDPARPRSSPAPPGSSRLRANTPTPLPIGPLLRTGSAGTGPSRWRRERRAGWPQRKSAGSGTYRDPTTARLGAVRHIRQTAAEWVCSDVTEEKNNEKFTLFSRAVFR